MINPVLGQPGIQTGTSVVYGQVFKQPESVLYLPYGGHIDASAQDFGSTNPLCLRAGLAMGQVSATKKWLPAFMGKVLTSAVGPTDTTFTVSVAAAKELVRRIGTSGTFKLTGPPTANGVVRTVVVTYSAVNTSTGVITITAIGVNEVQTVALGATMTAGTIGLTVTKSDGTIQQAKAAFDTNWTTTVSDLQTNINALLGASAVALAVTNTHDMTVTFSGTGYLALPQPLVSVDVTGATSTTTGSVSRTTAGVDGRFAVGSFVQPSDGSETPRTVIPDGSGILMTTGNVSDVDFPQIAYKGLLRTAGIIDYPTDTGLQAWLRSNMANRDNGVLFEFDDLTNAA